MRATLILVVVALVIVTGYILLRAPALPSSSSPKTASPIASMLEGHLYSADGTAFAFPASAPVGSLKYIALYYSAQWCPPCHIFTPLLADWYRKFKPGHPGFELIFVSDDRDKTAWLAYMKEMAMPWPAFSFDDLQQDNAPIKKFAGDGIPDLVLVDASGKVLADSFRNGAYAGPEVVVGDINRLVGGASPVALESPQ